MIHLIYGAKGSGKTKKIIEMANASIDTAGGDIVFITDTNRYMFDIKYQIRFVNTEEHHIFTEEALLGFIKGLIAGNHDIKTIYIDGAHRIARKEVENMQDFYSELEAIAERQDVEFVLCVSKNEEELPDFLKKYL
ncbi:MAG: ATP-binding protein [Eubacteriales bacterium]|nr:ATP-binding protein [Christensenellaceae bacterium]MCI7583513.1 ATP-binding protein [Christensenellaceae bacterium]MCI7769414.1 ATP-binding protein [Christensenellaceae bacterium]MDD6361109.1 ATP-binding protein [Christensenellaceae bacterium]MDY4710027.1 ATP-binding protein [Eubacteriales bacterium]